MLESAITAEEGKRLLQLVRRAIECALADAPCPRPGAEELTDGMREPLGAFVTLYCEGELRGCIGRMQFNTPLIENVLEAAVASALHDPRFPSVTAKEVPRLKISLSVLDEPQPIEHYDQFDPDRHGIVMELGFQHGTFLPKVAHEYGWDRATTLTMLCRKVGVADDAWQRSDAKFKVYNAIEFVEGV